MKKRFAFLAAILCVTVALCTSCARPSWNLDRATELSNIPTNQETPEQFDEMLEQLEAGWELMKNSDIPENETDEQKDERRNFWRVFTKLGNTANSAAHARKRVVSDQQVANYEALKEKINKEMMEIMQKKAQERK